MSSNKTETRNKILRTTWKLMETQQGHAVRMADIAKAAGISRQAVYLHFGSRTDLLVATTHYVDEVSDLRGRLADYEAATSGEKMLDEYIEFWGNYLPIIYGLGKSLLLMQATDEAAAAAWADRMAAIRGGCQRIVETLEAEGKLAEVWLGASGDVETAVSLLATLLSLHNWEQLRDTGWSNETYTHHIKRLARQAFINNH